MHIRGYIKSKIIQPRGNLKIYKPLYNYYEPLSSDIPLVYNEEGKPYDFYFLRDIHSAHAPYRNTGKYFIWDRYNWGLKTHFYTHNAMLQTMGEPDRRFGMLMESRSIVPQDYKIFQKHKGLEREFDVIFTYDEELLNKLPNAKFFPWCAQVWYGKCDKGFCWDPECYKHKNRQISIVSSDKRMCHLHEVRLELSRFCKRNQLADTFGTFDGGWQCLIDDTLRDYRYSIIMENDISDYFFTEKITNCFAAQTIPIYLGARKIKDFFNEDGIIYIDEKGLKDIEKVLKQCTKEEYERRRQAVIDNYQRVQKYRNMQDYLYEQYLAKSSFDNSMNKG